MNKEDRSTLYALACDGPLSADTISGLSADTINRLGAYTISRLGAYTINRLSAYTINRLSADTISGLSADTISGLGADTISGLSADTISRLSAYRAMVDALPVIEKPYTKLLAAINAGERKHDQGTFGPDCDPEKNLCGTRMCTAGHLVNMAGAAGYAMKAKYGFPLTAAAIHAKAHPGLPHQNFGAIPQEHAMAYIEHMAEIEAAP